MADHSHADAPASERDSSPVMPSQVNSDESLFDHFADMVGRFTSRAWFFVFCVAIVVVWAPSYFLFDQVDTWQLIINTLTTIVTFLLVALLQNTQKRSDDAVQHKLNAIAKGLADLMQHASDGEVRRDLERDRRDLLRAVGLESREGS
jgi:low affinity Fe/Cu permease